MRHPPRPSSLARLAATILTVALLAACSRAVARPSAVEAPAERNGNLGFTRADSLVRSLEGSIATAIAEPGAAVVLLNAGPQGCEQLVPKASYSLEGTRLHIFVSGFSRVVICHGPGASGPTRVFAARVADLAPGTYDVVIQFASDAPGAQPLVKSVTIP